VGELGTTESRYVEMIEAASDQMGDLVEALALVARIESGRYRPNVQAIDTRTLARAVQEQIGGDHVDLAGDGGAVAVEAGPAERALTGLTDCVRRHGGVDVVRVDAGPAEVTLSPVPDDAAPIVLAEDMRDLGAATAHVVVRALGGSIALTSGTLVVRLPAA
jgi:signal transduction histidine kinase